MATVGVDCHITLQHASVNVGAAVGFVLKTDKRGPVFELERERWGVSVWADLGAHRSRVACIVMAFPRLLTPNGSDYALTAAQVRTHLNSFWATTTPMTLVTPAHSLSVMWDTDGLAEHVYGDGAEFRLKLITV